MWEQDPRFLLESLKNIIVIDVPRFAPRISLCVLKNKCSKPKSAEIGHFLINFLILLLKYQFYDEIVLEQSCRAQNLLQYQFTFDILLNKSDYFDDLCTINSNS